MSNKDAVNLDHVTRRYRRDDFEVHALDDVTIQVPAQTFVAIMGPSGFRQDDNTQSDHRNRSPDHGPRFSGQP